MYREFLDEFVKMADEVTEDELEVIADAIIEGLSKMADEEMDKLDKVASILDDMEKAAALEDIDAEDAAKAALGLGAAGVGAATAIGLKNLKNKMPEWKANSAKARSAKFQNKADIAKRKAEIAGKASVRSNAELGITSGGGVTSGGGAGTNYSSVGGQSSNYDGAYQKRSNKFDLTKRLNMDSGDATMLAGDAKALKAKDWLGKNKFKVLAGLGAGALLLNQINKNKQKDSELRGAYSIAGSRRY